LSSDRVAYHIKRLICESIAEIEPEDADWNLIRFISKDYSNLFCCFIERVVSYEWLIFLKQQWLPLAKSSPDRQVLLHRFLWRLEVWKDRYPAEVIELWIEAVQSDWLDRRSLTILICGQLNGLQNWAIARIEYLLKLIMQGLPEDRNYSFTNSLAKWIAANNYGDRMLWQYITRSVSDDDVSSGAISNKLVCISLTLDEESFLENRLSKSEELLNLAVESIEKWSKITIPYYCNEGELWDIFLSKSSHRLKHSSGVIHDVNSLTCLLSGIEKVLQQHCQANSRWWQENEPRLRNTRDACLRYLLIQAYKVNIEDNLKGITAQIENKQLFKYCYLGDELRELIKIACLYL